MFIPYHPLPSHTTVTILRLTYPPNSSVISFGSISPTMVTGSPGSLFLLTSELEILLVYMESLDLDVRG